MATVKDSKFFNVEDDCQVLYEAMHGAGTDEDAIIDILANRSLKQRQKIQESYKGFYGEDLIEMFNKELSGNFLTAVLYSFMDREHVNAMACYRAMEGLGTDDRVLMDVVLSSREEELYWLRDAYDEILMDKNISLSERSFEKDIKKDTSGDYQRLLVAMISAKREKKYTKDQVQRDCDDLIDAANEAAGAAETFTRILTNRDPEMIKDIDGAYFKKTGEYIKDAVKKLFTGDYRKGLKVLLNGIMSRTQFYAYVLDKSMRGLGTHEENAIRLIMAHSSVDLADIRKEFDRTYEKTLEQSIRDDFSGDIQRFLLAMIGCFEIKFKE